MNEYIDLILLPVLSNRILQKYSTNTHPKNVSMTASTECDVTDMANHGGRGMSDIRLYANSLVWSIAIAILIVEIICVVITVIKIKRRGDTE